MSLGHAHPRVLEAVRRAVEVGLAWMIIISIAYMACGHYIPGLLNSRPFTAAEILEASWLVPTAGGVYGPLTGIVATTIAVFIVFVVIVRAVIFCTPNTFFVRFFGISKYAGPWICVGVRGRGRSS